MFCPECGCLSFPTPCGNINCNNWKCGYQGPATIIVRDSEGRGIDLSRVISSTKAESRTYEVIRDSDELKGTYTSGDYMCIKCDSEEVYSHLEARLDMAEVQVTMVTCKECGYGWREH